MTVSGPGQNGTWIGGTFYPMDDDMAEAAVDMVDQGSIFNVANQTGTMGFAQGGSTPWWAQIPEYLGAAGNAIRAFSGDPYGFDAIFASTQEVADYTNALSDTTADQTRGILQDITYSVTGQTPAEEYTALLGYPGTYYDEGASRAYGATPRIAGMAATPETAAGFGDLDYSKQVGDLRGILDSYSPFGRPGMDLAKNPPVVSIDPSRYDKQIEKYLDTEKMSKMYDYSSPQTQAFLSPKNEGYKPQQEYTRQAMTDYYGGDKARKDFMTYSAY